MWKHLEVAASNHRVPPSPLNTIWEGFEPPDRGQRSNERGEDQDGVQASQKQQRRQETDAIIHNRKLVINEAFCIIHAFLKIIMVSLPLVV